MTRKHFKALAAAIKGITNASERDTVARLIGKVCQGENMLFDWARWSTACNVK